MYPCDGYLQWRNRFLSSRRDFLPFSINVPWRWIVTPEEHKALARRFLEEGWDKGNLKVLDEVLAPNFVDHNPPPGLSGDREGQKQAITMWRAAFPDLKSTIEDLIVEGDKVAGRVTVRATHKGEFMGIPPTGKQVMIEGMFIGRATGGKIAETWEQFDAAGLMQQLGAMPSPEKATGR